MSRMLILLVLPGAWKIFNFPFMICRACWKFFETRKLDVSKSNFAITCSSSHVQVISQPTTSVAPLHPLEMEQWDGSVGSTNIVRYIAFTLLDRHRFPMNPRSSSHTLEREMSFSFTTAWAALIHQSSIHSRRLKQRALCPLLTWTKNRHGAFVLTALCVGIGKSKRLR